jgi:hypothetical protein
MRGPSEYSSQNRHSFALQIHQAFACISHQLDAPDSGSDADRMAPIDPKPPSAVSM